MNLDDMISAQMDALAVPLADGVEGLVIDHGWTLEVGMIRAVTEGSGHVGAWLDRLPRDRRVTVPWVTSTRLAGMLERRGFRPVQRFAPSGEWGTVWVRKPKENNDATDT